jgi:hypothetical protein
MQDQILCLIRRKWVSASPEEKVRQALIYRLTHELGYHRPCLGIEQSLKQMPHLQTSAIKLPSRRADLICFSRGLPLLLVECKAVKLNQAIKRQVIGYNYYLKAPYLAIVNQEEAQFGWYDPSLQDFHFIPHLPPYEKLIQAVTSTPPLLAK